MSPTVGAPGTPRPLRALERLASTRAVFILRGLDEAAVLLNAGAREAAGVGPHAVNNQ
jgi:hypothetical protein